VKVTIFGLGYVGVVSAGCLARDGHQVLGIDPSASKTELLRQGISPIVEPGLETLIAEAVKNRRLQASDRHEEGVRHAELMFICVGTPGQSNGSLDLSYVRRVCEQVGSELARADGFKVVTVRSTMLPGTMESVVIPTLEQFSGKRAGHDFGVCINPEFLREGTAIADFDHPPKTVIGSTDERAESILRSLYVHLTAPVICTALRTAEMVKYVDNAWHALKVTFANEIGRLGKAMDVDSREIMRLFTQDTKLNLSPSYLRPGFAFGGSCLPKDMRALTYRGRNLDVETPMLSAILPSNDIQIGRAIAMIRATGKRRIGLLGLSFKEGTDDLRESPVVTLAEQLIGKGYELVIFDRNVRLASLIGANREYILNHIPHIGRLLVDHPEELFERSECIVAATGEKNFGTLMETLGGGKVIVDLVGIWPVSPQSLADNSGSYDGIAW
jgi:GDP-mannose 6-dehydrogenase